ncbi:MAG: response regulator [Patescibacteria group bacterium]|nr:response regulator [Patescibacteria group bacterium]
MKKILLVEDEDIIRELLTTKLKKEGYAVTIACNGEEAMEKMRTSAPDLILLDIVMPKKGGMEVMEEMQIDPELKKIPVIVISNSGQPVDIDRAQELGAKDWLIKTEFDPQEVINKIIKQIG